MTHPLDESFLALPLRALADAGLDRARALGAEHADVRVVRTRKVRALTEKFYGRTAFLFLFQSEDPEDARGIGASMLRQAAGALELSPDGAGWGHVQVRLTDRDRLRFERRLGRLMNDFLAAVSEAGEPCALAGVIYRRPDV